MIDPLQQSIFEEGPRSTFVQPPAQPQEVKGQVIIAPSAVAVTQGVDFSGLGAALNGAFDAYRVARADLQQRRSAAAADGLSALDDLTKKPIDLTDNMWENPRVVDSARMQFEDEYRKRLIDLGMDADKIDDFTAGKIAARDVNDDLSIQEGLVRYRALYNNHVSRLNGMKSELDQNLYNGTIENLKMGIDNGFKTKEDASVSDILADFDSNITDAIKSSGLPDTKESYDLVTGTSSLSGYDNVTRRRVEGIRELYGTAIDARTASLRNGVEAMLDKADVEMADEMSSAMSKPNVMFEGDYIGSIKKRYDARVAEIKDIYKSVPGYSDELISQRAAQRISNNPNIPFSGSVLAVQKLDTAMGKITAQLAAMDPKDPTNADAVVRLTDRLEKMKESRNSVIESVTKIPPGLLSPQNQKVYGLLQEARGSSLAEIASKNATEIIHLSSDEMVRKYSDINNQFDRTLSMLADMSAASKGTVKTSDFIGALRTANVDPSVIEGMQEAFNIGDEDGDFSAILDESRIDQARSVVVQKFFARNGMPLDTDGTFVDKNSLTSSVQRKLFERKSIETGDMGFADLTHKGSQSAKRKADDDMKVRNLALGVPMSAEDSTKVVKAAADTIASTKNYPGYMASAMFKTYTRDAGRYLASTFGTEQGRRRLIANMIDPSKSPYFDLKDMRTFSRSLMEDANLPWGGDSNDKREAMRFAYFTTFLTNKLASQTGAKSEHDYKINPESIDAEFTAFSRQWDKTFDFMDAVSKGRGDSLVSVHKAVMGLASGSDMASWHQGLPIGESKAVAVEKKWGELYGKATFWQNNQMPELGNVATDVVTPLVIALSSAAPDATVDDIVNTASSIASMYGNVRPKTITLSDGTKQVFPSRDVRYATETPPSIAPVSDGDTDPSMVTPTDALEHTYSSIVYGGSTIREGAYPASRKKLTPELRHQRDDMYKIAAGFANGKVTPEYIKTTDPMTSGVIEALCDWADNPKMDVMSDPRIQKFVSFNGTVSKDSEQYKSRENFIWRHTGLKGRGDNDGKLTGLAMVELGLNMYAGAPTDVSPEDRSRFDIWRRLGDYDGVYEADVDPDAIVNKSTSTEHGGMSMPQPAMGPKVILNHSMLKAYGVDLAGVGSYGGSVYGPRVNKDIATFQGGDYLRNRVGRKFKASLTWLDTRNKDWMVEVDPNNPTIYYALPMNTSGMLGMSAQKTDASGKPLQLEGGRYRITPDYKRNRWKMNTDTIWSSNDWEVPIYMFTK